MKIAYVTTYDAMNIRSWSGIPYYMAQSLKNQFVSLEYISSLREKYSLLFKAKQHFYSRVLNKRYLRNREPLILKNYALQVSRQLSQVSPDIVFSPGTIPIAYLECDQPIVFWVDATFAGMIDFYPGFSNLCKETVRNGNAMEQSALDRCTLAIYSSNWAAQTAIQNYQVDQSKVKVVPFGANIKCDRTLDDIKDIVESRPSNKCKLLFLGVDWARKGGDIALKVARQLNETGFNTELIIAGCQPVIEEPMPGYVRTVGFISKATEEGRSLIETLLAESHFLILPSRAEAYGVVFSEANSFGVPCISTNVGGISTAIRDDLNGSLFSKDATIEEYCTYISNLFSNYALYKQLAVSSFNEFSSRLNWSVAGQTVKKLLMNIVG